MKIEWNDENETVSFSQTKRINEMIDKFKLIDAQKTYLTPMEKKFLQPKATRKIYPMYLIDNYLENYTGFHEHADPI